MVSSCSRLQLQQSSLKECAVLPSTRAMCRLSPQTELAFKKLGVEAVVMSAGELESEVAGQPGRLIRERYRSVHHPAGPPLCQQKLATASTHAERPYPR
jgi:hypothetical protein